MSTKKTFKKLKIRVPNDKKVVPTQFSPLISIFRLCIKISKNNPVRSFLQARTSPKIDLQLFFNKVNLQIIRRKAKADQYLNDRQANLLVSSEKTQYLGKQQSDKNSVEIPHFPLLQISTEVRLKVFAQCLNIILPLQSFGQMQVMSQGSGLSERSESLRKISLNLTYRSDLYRVWADVGNELGFGAIRAKRVFEKNL